MQIIRLRHLGNTSKKQIKTYIYTLDIIFHSYIYTLHRRVSPYKQILHPTTN